MSEAFFERFVTFAGTIREGHGLAGQQLKRFVAKGSRPPPRFHEAEYFVIGHATGPSEEIAAGLKVGKLVPQYDAGILKNLFGVVIVEHQRHNEAVDPPRVPRKLPGEFLPVRVRTVENLSANRHPHPPLALRLPSLSLRRIETRSNS